MQVAYGTIAAWCLALCLELALGPTLLAQERRELGNDYYAASRSEWHAQLLRDNEMAHLGKAQKHLATRKSYELEYALADFGYILSRWPNHPQALQGMFETARLLNRPQLVERYARAALEVAPNSAPTFVMIGTYLMRQGQLKEAEPLLTRAIQIDPESINANYNLGLLYAQTQRLELANRHAQKAYALGHPMPGLRNRLEAAGAWQPLPAEPAPTAATSPAAPATPAAPPSAPPERAPQ